MKRYDETVENMGLKPDTFGLARTLAISPLISGELLDFRGA